MEDLHLKLIGKKIKTMRVLRGIEQASLGYKVNNTDRFIEKVEAGKIDISIDTLVKIASELGCELDISITPIEELG